jgi:ADP-heptose:LPS heptosyltransferase
VRSITLRRTGALGDVLCITPVIRKLRQEFPAVEIAIETAHPVAVEKNPDLTPRPGATMLSSILRYDLDLVYERRPSLHVVDAYMEHVFPGAPIAGEEKTLRFQPAGPWKNPEVVVIHAATSWASRTFTPVFWDRVALAVRDLGMKPVFVGGGYDYGGPIWATSTLTKLHLRQVASLITGAAAFIGSDSALLHLAGTTETPIIGLYTSVRAKYRMPYRHGKLGWNMIAIEPDLDCRGCLERIPAPVTNMSCQRGDSICSRSIPHEAVTAALKKLRPDRELPSGVWLPADLLSGRRAPRSPAILPFPAPR